MNRGDIVYVNLPKQSPAGREQFGTRPAIIVQDEPRLANLPTVIVVPLTTQKSALRFLGAFLIALSATKGLQAESVAMCFQIRAIDRNRITQVIGKIDTQDLANLNLHTRKLLRL